MTRRRAYPKSLADRVGIDRAIIVIRAMPYAIVGGGTIGGIGGVVFFGPIGGLVGFVVGTLVAFYAASFMTEGTAWLVRNALEPNSIAYRQTWSRIEAHVARGELDAAAVLYEEALVGVPDDLELRSRAADFFAGPIARHARALELFQSLQRDVAAPAERQLYASQRIVDLHLGPLPDKGRALVELRRIVDRWPNSHAARFGRDAMRRLKAELHGDGDGPG